MMQMLRKAAAGITVFAMLLTIGGVFPEYPLRAAAEDAALQLKIEEIDIDIADLEAMNYQVPVYVRLENNPGITYFEYGVEVDSRCSYEVIHNNRDVSEYGGSESLMMNSITRNHSTKNMSWFFWASASVEDSVGALVMLSVSVPEDAQDGDVYPIRYISSYEEGEEYGTRQHLWGDSKSGTDYVNENSVMWEDGYIHVFDSENPVPVPTEPASGAAVQVAIDQIVLTKSELEAKENQVPVYVKATKNPGVDAIEFGLQVDNRCDYRVITNTYNALEFGNGILDIRMTYDNDKSGKNFSWLTWASSKPEAPESLVLLLVTLPEDAEVGDVYSVNYLAQSVAAGVDASHVWKNVKEGNINYAAMEQIVWRDGRIKIVSDAVSLYGDTDSNGELDIIDVIVLNRYLMLGEPLSEQGEINADVDQNGSVDATDSLNILKAVVKLAELPII